MYYIRHYVYGSTLYFKTLYFNAAGARRHLGRNEFEPSSSQLMERGLYNAQVAGPPAALALGLMYFGSNNARVACPLLPGVDFARFVSGARPTVAAAATSATRSNMITSDQQQRLGSTGTTSSITSNSGSAMSNDPLPVNVAELDRVPPELFTFRALAHALIYWDAIEPTRHWVHAHFPHVRAIRVQLHQNTYSDSLSAADTSPIPIESSIYCICT